VRSLSHRKLYREVVGGLALLVFGLRVMARGSRQFAGQRSQALLARIGRRRGAAVGFGVGLGAITQFTSTSAGIVVGLVESHLLATLPALGVLLGAQLGAGLAPSVLGLASTKEGLLVLGIGVLWLGLASDRRSEAFAKIVVGGGLLFFGLYVLRQGFEPLVADPDLLPYLDRLDAGTLVGRLTCVAAGVLLTALLQGPAPVFVLVLGLAQSTGRLDLASALAILAGTGLGSAIGAAIVASPFGAEARRLSRLYLVLALLGTIALAASAGPWAALADTLVPGRAAALAWGKKILLPQIAAHLLVGFALSQVTITVLLALAAAPVGRLLARLRPLPAAGPAPARAATPAAIRQDLSLALAQHGRALTAIHQLCMTGHRTHGRDGEHVLQDARAELAGLFAAAVRDDERRGEAAQLRRAALAIMQLQRALEDLLRHAERTTEQHVALSPAGEVWRLAPRDESALQAVHNLLLDGLATAALALGTGRAPDLDAARAREIRLNAIEAETRHALLADPGGDLALRLNSGELVNAYETVGNHLYRLHEALAADVEQDTQIQSA
jgi:Na+/phosphate symporter